MLSILQKIIERAEPPQERLDDHGQVKEKRVNWRRLEDRQIDELIGMCRMAISDGSVNETEARALLKWLQQNRESADRWPASVLHNRLVEILADGRIDKDEEKELTEILMQISGKPIEENLAQMSTSLPLCRPAPEIQFENRVFCLTGKFFLGPRKKCENMIVDRGGGLAPNPTKETDFLVIGMVGSEQWLHSTHGRKIEHAVQLRQKGKKIHIVSEEHWTKSL